MLMVANGFEHKFVYPMIWITERHHYLEVYYSLKTSKIGYHGAPWFLNIGDSKLLLDLLFIILGHRLDGYLYDNIIANTSNQKITMIFWGSLQLGGVTLATSRVFLPSKNLPKKIIVISWLEVLAMILS